MRSSRRPKNQVEGECYDALTAEGYTLTKRGCPDFFVFKGDDFSLVECKKQGVPLKAEQVAVMRAFITRGIKCCVWRKGAGLEKLTLDHPLMNPQEPEKPVLKARWPDEQDGNSEG